MELNRKIRFGMTISKDEKKLLKVLSKQHRLSMTDLLMKALKYYEQTKVKANEATKEKS